MDWRALNDHLRVQTFEINDNKIMVSTTASDIFDVKRANDDGRETRGENEVFEMTSANFSCESKKKNFESRKSVPEEFKTSGSLPEYSVLRDV